MKIGILTFHSQLNYGGVLQCWALQTVLEKMGHEVVVIDREFEHQIRSVVSVFKGWGFFRWVKFIVKLLMQKSEALRTFRYIRTVQFAKKQLHLTSYSFKEWSDAPLELGVDLIVVGSDQVWNDVWQNPGVYLLEGTQCIPALGYAISLGMTKLPNKDIERYQTAAERFEFISVREREAREVLSVNGIEATHVADPVLLVDWPLHQSLTGRDVFCYFVSPVWTSSESLKSLVSCARTQDCMVHIFTNTPCKKVKSRYIKYHPSGGPLQFLRAVASAKCVLTDSFHGLMFSYIYDKDVCMLVDQKGGRREMFSRISEFLDDYVTGDCIAHSLSEGMEKLFDDSRVEYKREKCSQFIDSSRNYLESCCSSIALKVNAVR